MIQYDEHNAMYNKVEGPPLKLGDFVTLHTGEHMLERPPQEQTIEGCLVRVWVVQVSAFAFIPITELFLSGEAPAPVDNPTRH